MAQENEVETSISLTGDRSAIPEKEMELLQAVDKAIIRAGQLLDMEDIPEDLDGDIQSAYDEAYEDRYHCGKCVVRLVMETIWDDLSALMDYYDNREPAKTQ